MPKKRPKPQKINDVAASIVDRFVELALGYSVSRLEWGHEHHGLARAIASAIRRDRKVMVTKERHRVNKLWNQRRAP